MTHLGHFRDFPSPPPRAPGTGDGPCCTSLLREERCAVRRLVLGPGEAIDLHCHLHRSEHWLVVSGAARVTLDGRARDLFEGQSLDIPVGCWHRIENQGKVDLQVIEVQRGTCLDDDALTPAEAGPRGVPVEPFALAG